jgi:hypothetical protein
LKFKSTKRCEIGRSSRAATRLDKVLSSGINNCRLFAVELVLGKIPEAAFSLNSLAVACSRKENLLLKTSNVQKYLVVLV